MASDPAPSGWRRPRTRGRRVALAVWAGLATFVILLVLDGLWAGRTLIRGLTRARAELAVAIESVVTGDPGAAAPHFVAAQEASDDALGAVGHPSLGIAGLLPVVGENIEAAAAVAEASEATAAAGTTMVRVARDLGWSDIRIPGSTAAGRLDLEAFEAALPPMESVTARLQNALRTLEEAGGDGLIGPVATGYRDAVDGLSRRADLARRLRDSMRLVTVMFGGQHRFLVCVPVLGLPRPGGGTPAAVGVLAVDDGALDLEPLTPAPIAFRDAPSSLDWPSTARALMDAAERSQIGVVDGVILIDAVALQDLVWTVGDVEVERPPLALSDRTTTEALEIDAFSGNSPRGASRRHAEWASAILQAFLERRPGVESFALAAAGDARERHLAVFLPGREGRGLTRALGLEGRAMLKREGTLPVAASWSTTQDAHVGALVDTTVRQTITVRPNGSVAVEAQILFDNTAGTDPPSILLGRPVGDLPVGTFEADVTLYIPDGAEDIAAETSRPSPIAVGRALGLATVTGTITVRSGESTTLTVSYVVPDVVRTVDGAREIFLRVVPHPTLRGVGFQLRVVPPEGSSILSASAGFRARGGAAVFSGVRGGALDLEVRFGAGRA